MGGYMKHLNEFVNLLLDPDMLRLSGFHCLHTEWDGTPLGAAGWEERRLHCLRGDEFANYYGSACLGWVAARAQRGAHYWGWPEQLFK